MIAKLLPPNRYSDACGSTTGHTLSAGKVVSLLRPSVFAPPAGVIGRSVVCLARLYLLQPRYRTEVFHLTFTDRFPQLATIRVHTQLQQVHHFAPGGLGAAIVNELEPRHVEWQTSYLTVWTQSTQSKAQSFTKRTINFFSVLLRVFSVKLCVIIIPLDKSVGWLEWQIDFRYAVMNVQMLT